MNPDAHRHRHIRSLWLRVARRLSRARSDTAFALLDGSLVAAAYLAALVLRFDGHVPARFWNRFDSFLALAVVAHLAANWAWGLYGQLWRNASIEEARQIFLAEATALAFLLLAVVEGDRLVPISVLVVGSVLATVATGVARFQSRLFAFQRTGRKPAGLRVAVLGAGEAGADLVRDMLRNRAAGLVPVAVLDDDPRTHGRLLSGVKVLGPISALPHVVERHDVHQAILAVPSARQALVRRAAAAAEEAGIPLRVLPSMTELVSRTVSVRDVRDLRIEDLLGRQEVVMDLERVRRIVAGQRVLITGAGGSIGSEIARQVAELEPEMLVLLDHDETHLHDAVAKISGVEPVVVLGDVRCAERTAAAFRRHRPTVVFHAAALKHVPLLEQFPVEAVSTNVIGTRNVVAAAKAVGTERFVFISTDKAVRPTSVMGASKRLGEQIVLTEAPPGAGWCAVRFGNVLGSRGSVVPTFIRQIAAGGPVTVTDIRMRRFFMSIEEAVRLVLQAAAMAPAGNLFMLEMGEPVRIVDLAERMIRLAGFRPGIDIEIRVTGPRPGEKLTEELCAPDEHREPTDHPHVVRVVPSLPPVESVRAAVELLEVLAALRDAEQTGMQLRNLAAGVIDLNGVNDTNEDGHGDLAAVPTEGRRWSLPTT